MRFDGHVKITLQALDILTRLSQRKDMIWPAPSSKIGDKSTALGHWSGVLGYLGSPNAGLPELVEGVSDITTAQSHFTADLQRLHFMRASDETELTAYHNCVNFIVDEMEAWIRARMESVWRGAAREATRDLLSQIPALEKGIRVDAHLAKALHCLQDSFSPGHVLRSETDGSLVLGTAKKNASPACYGSAPPIRNIFDYNHPSDDAGIEAKHQHDASDYYAGSLEHAAANAAAYASADLIQIGLDSIATRSSNSTAWRRFSARWLTHKLRTDVPKKAGAVNLDALLQRSCSPSKMVCGRCPE
jgi:hypothetical protein